jgi:Family of unknown function (DUF6338)
VPTNVAGLLLFVALLAPGFMYVLRREAERPQQPVSAFRETVALAFVSVTCDLVVLLLILVPARILIPQSTPDVGALVREPGAYVREYYALLAAWGAGLLAVACLLGATLASSDLSDRAGQFVRRIPGLRWLAPSPTRRVQPVSAWWRLFHAHDHLNARIYVGCELDDGSYVAGWLYSYTPDLPETGDRDLVLTAPVQLCAAGATDERAAGEGQRDSHKRPSSC